MIVVADTGPLNYLVRIGISVRASTPRFTRIDHLAGLLDIDEALNKLRSTNFRLTPDVEHFARRRLTKL
jgi:hypothetical protein